MGTKKVATMNHELKILCLTAVAVAAAAAGPCAAQQANISVPNSCYAGQAFTIVVPVQAPAGVRVDYRWYRNGALIAGAAGMLNDAGVVKYTIPAGSAHGLNVAFYFDYRQKGTAEYSLSPIYVISFTPIEGSEPPICGGTVAGAVGNTCSTASGAIGSATCSTISGAIGTTCSTASGVIGSTCGTISGTIGTTCSTISGAIGTTCGTTPGAIGS